MDMNSFFSMFENVTQTFTVIDVLGAILLSFSLSLVIGWIYKITYKGTSYSQAYVHTLIMMSMIVAIIMLVIGSNIARAFSLVGALSIIRFRNAVKDTRDIGYIFFAMAIGMACGTGFYLLATVSTGLMSFILWEMDSLNLFAASVREERLKLRVPMEMNYQEVIETLFPRYLTQYRLISIKSGKEDGLTRLEYLVELRDEASRAAFMEELRRLTYNNPVSLTAEQPEEVW